MRNIFTVIIMLWLSTTILGQEKADQSQSIPRDSVNSELAQTQDNAPNDSLPPLEKNPELLSFVKAYFPDSLIRKGFEGIVVLNLLVNDSGRVDSVGLEKSLYPVLDTSAMIAARQFVFSPAIAGGQPVPVLMRYEYRFSVQDVVEKVEQYVNFQGVLLEKGTRKPIRDAMVVIAFTDTTADTSLMVPFSVYRKKLGTFPGQYLEEDRLVTITDSMGQFAFRSLPVGPISLTSPIVGYEEFKQKEQIIPNDRLTVKYYLTRVSYSDYEIVVYGKQEEKEVARQQLSLSEIKRIPGFGGDAVKVIQALPGVARPTFISGEIVVRGAPTWDSKFSLNGGYLAALYHFGGVKSIYNSDALEKIDFYPGGYSVRYGDCVGGAIELTSRQAKQDRLHVKVDMSTLDGSVLIEGPVNDKVSMLGTVRRSFFGEIFKYTAEHSNVELPFTVLPYYWDYVIRTDIKAAPKHSISVTGFGFKDSVDVYVKTFQGGSAEVSEQANSVKQGTLMHMGMLGWDWDCSDRLSNSLRYQILYSAEHFSIFGFARWNIDQFLNGVRNELRFKASEKVTAVAGVDLSSMNVDFAMTQTSSSGQLKRDTVNDWLFGDYAPYLMVEWKPIPGLMVIPGLRYDYFPELDYRGSIVPAFWKYSFMRNNRGISGEPSFRVNARYEWKKNHTIKAALGNYSQTPQPIGQTIMSTYGDPKMPATKAAHYVMGYEWRATDLIYADLQAYLNRQWDIPRMADKNDLSPDGTVKNFIADGIGRMYGIELMLRHDQGERFFGWIAYTLSRSERYNRLTKEYELYEKDQTNNFQAVGSWKLKNNWDLGFRFRYCTGNPETPVIGKYLSENGDYFVPIFGKKFSQRQDPFVQLDVRIDKTVVFKKWISSWYFDLQNISYFIYKSPEFTDWNYDYTAKQSIYMPPVPGVGFKIEF